MELNEKLRQADEDISANAAYLSKVSIQERQLRWGDSGEDGGGDGGDDDDYEEEEEEEEGSLTIWIEWAATGAEEMLDVGEKPAGFNFGRS